MTQPSQDDPVAEFSARLKRAQSEERSAAEKRAAEILAVSVNYDWTDIFGRVILWALLVPDDPRQSRNDLVSLDPIAEYVICWLYSQVSKWDGAVKPPVTPSALATILIRGQEQVDNSWFIRDRRSQSSSNQEPSAESSIAAARESFELLADHEVQASTGIRYPLHPTQWRKYLASIYGPLTDGLQRILGFDYATLAKLTDALRHRLQQQVNVRLDNARSFHKRALVGTKRLRTGRKLQGVDDNELRLFQGFAAMRPSESKAAIHWHAMHRTLDGAAELVSIAETDADVVQEIGADSVRALLKSAALRREILNPDHYALPNPSPEVQYTPFIPCGHRALVVNPTSLSYYADNIIWAASSPYSALQDQISARRAQFTQSHTADCLRLVFGSDTVLEGIEIVEASTNVKMGEFDVLVVSSAGIIAIECKSGRWSRPAQRGALGSIKKKMQELYFEPIVQVGNRIQQLRASKTLVLRDKRHETVEIDWRAASLCVGMVVHLAPIDAVQAHSYLTPKADYADAVDALVLCGLTYLETACQTLRAPGLIFDYLLQRARLSADRRVGAADENEWLAFYLETGLRMRTFSDQSVTLGHLSANTAQLDAFIYSGFGCSLRPTIASVPKLLPVIESIKDHHLQFHVVSVLMEQSPENNVQLARWIDCQGRTEATNPRRNELVVLYSVDGTRSLAMYFVADKMCETRSGKYVDRSRELLRDKPTCLSCVLMAIMDVAGSPQTYDVFDLALA